MIRNILPARRINRTIKLEWQGHTFYLTVGFYDECLERPGEIFADSGKIPEGVKQLVQDACVIISISLQYDVPPSALCKSIPRHDDGTPYTILGVICDLLATSDWRSDV